MISESNPQRTLLAVSSLGRWEYLLHLSCFGVYVDLLLILSKAMTIGELDLGWLRGNVSLGATLVAIAGYSFVKSFALPAIDVLYFLLCVLPISYLRVQDLPPHKIDLGSWLSYAILTRNTPAYQEVGRIRTKNLELQEGSNNCRHLSVLLIIDYLLGRVAGKSLISDLFSFAYSLPLGGRYILLAALFLFFIALGFQAVLAPILGCSVYVSIGNRALVDEVQRTLEAETGERRTHQQKAEEPP